MQYIMILCFLLKEKVSFGKTQHLLLGCSCVSNSLVGIKALIIAPIKLLIMQLNSPQGEQKEEKYCSRGVIQSLEKRFPGRLMPEHGITAK